MSSTHVITYNLVKAHGEVAAIVEKIHFITSLWSQLTVKHVKFSPKFEMENGFWTLKQRKNYMERVHVQGRGEESLTHYLVLVVMVNKNP